MIRNNLAPRSNTLAWKIPWMEEPGVLQSMVSLRVGHNWVTRLSLFTFHFHALKKEMATHSSVLARRIPRMWEPGGLPSMGSHRVGNDWSDLAAAAAETIYLRSPKFKMRKTEKDREADGWFQGLASVVGHAALGCLHAASIISQAALPQAAAPALFSFPSSNII